MLATLNAPPLPARLIVVPLITDAQHRLLLCRMAEGRGVFPGQWALPGGGVEPGESLEDALRREIREELSIEVDAITPLFFTDAHLDKTMPDGTKMPRHMVFLVYRCVARTGAIRINEEFSEFAWFAGGELTELSLNPLTIQTLTRAGMISSARER